MLGLLHFTRVKLPLKFRQTVVLMIEIYNIGRKMFIFQNTVGELLGFMQMIKLFKDFQKRAKEIENRGDKRIGNSHLKEEGDKEHVRKVMVTKPNGQPKQSLVWKIIDFWDVQAKES